MYSFLSRPRMAMPLLAASLMLIPTLSAAQNARVVESGSSTLTVSSAFVSDLEALGVTVGTIRPTELVDNKVSFPIASGAVDLDTAKAQLLHSGGLTFTADSTQVDLSSFILDNTGKMPVITGLVVVNHQLWGRITLFDLAVPNGVSLPLKATKGEVVLSGVVVTLDPAAATTLNSIYKGTMFKAGFNLGTARIAAFIY